MRAIALLFAALLPLHACGNAETIAEVEMVAGSDPAAQLLAAAREEGRVSIYSSLPIDVMGRVASAFEAKTGVTADVWRGGSEEILQRAVAEARAGRHAVDVVETAAPEVEAIARERLLTFVDLPVYAELMPQTVAAGRDWVASRLIVFVAAYNTNLVRADEAPHTFEDLLDPRWRGRLTVEANDFSWLMGMADTLGEETALKLFRDIVATNGISVRDGHGLLTNMLASGEVPLTFTQYYEQAAHAKAQGAPVEVAFLNPVIAVPTGLAVFRDAPHPHAAELFLDFYLSEGQDILAEYDYIPANVSRQNLPDGLELTLADMSKFLDEYDKWRDLHREIFTAGSR